MKKLRIFLYRYAYQAIATVLLVLTIIFFLLSTRINNLKDLLVNMSAGSLTALLTVFFIDLLREGYKETKWGQARVIANEDLFELANMLVSYTTIPFGYKVTNYRKSEKDLKQWGFTTLKHILGDIRKKNISDLFKRFDVKKWEHLEMNLLFIKPTITDYLRTYNEVLTSNLLAKLLKVRRSFNKFYYLFGLVNIGFIKERKPVDKVLVNGLAEDLDAYFDSVDELFTEIEKLNEK